MVYDSVMDAAKYDPDVGTYWAPEDRACCGTTTPSRSHALSLRVPTELDPASAPQGVVQWLLLKKKLATGNRPAPPPRWIMPCALHAARGHLAIREAIDVRTGKRNRGLTSSRI